jgi:tetratricopeptide (TPR) repeat protein
VTQAGGQKMSRYLIIDELFKEGYELNLKNDSVGCCEKWLQAWDMIKALFAEGIAEDVFDLNSKYKWKQYPSNYVQYLEMELHNAGIKDKAYHRKRIDFCQELLRWSGTDELLSNNTRIAIAEAHYEIGDESGGEQLFKEWVREDPDCGWAYSGWSDCCRDDGSVTGNEKAEKILLAGYERSGLRDGEYVIERLITLYEEMGESEKVKEFEKIYANVQRAEQKDSKIRGSAPAKSEKIGRNAPCPCGSGKKYKKCCGA